MNKFTIISIIIIGCLVACWAIFHVIKKRKKAIIKKDTKPVDDKKSDKLEPEKIEDIQLTKKERLKIVKSAVLQPKVERVYEKDEQPVEEKPVVVVKNAEVKPKNIIRGDMARKIERVFSGEEKEEKAELPFLQEFPHEPVRTPSIADKIEFREHLSNIYGEFRTGVADSSKKASEIDRLQSEEDESEERVSFLDKNRSSIFATTFWGNESPVIKKTKPKISMKDMILAEAIMKRPSFSKKIKKVDKK